MKTKEELISVTLIDVPDYTLSKHDMTGLCKVTKNSKICHNKLFKEIVLPNDLGIRDYKTDIKLCQEHLDRVIEKDKLRVKRVISDSGLEELYFPWSLLYEKTAFYGGVRPDKIVVTLPNWKETN